MSVILLFFLLKRLAKRLLTFPNLLHCTRSFRHRSRGNSVGAGENGRADDTNTADDTNRTDDISTARFERDVDTGNDKLEKFKKYNLYSKSSVMQTVFCE